ncbi:Glycine-rich cell wall structural protein 1 [Balamuthia mandrillaris]
MEAAGPIKKRKRENGEESNPQPPPPHEEGDEESGGGSSSCSSSSSSPSAGEGSGSSSSSSSSSSSTTTTTTTTTTAGDSSAGAADSSSGGGGGGRPGKLTLEKVGVTACFQRKGWSYRFSEDGKSIISPFKGRNTSFTLVVGITRQCVQFVAVDIAQARNERRMRQICEGLLLINANLVLGHFVRNKKGEVLYQLSVPVLDAGRLTHKQIKRCIYAIQCTVNDHYPSITRLIWSNESVSEILEERQNPTDLSGCVHS